MTDNIDFSRYAGRVSFPRNSTDLVSTSQCPACLTPLTDTTCASCGLDLSNPAAAELHDVSLAIAATLDERLAIIGRIRYETIQTSIELAAKQDEQWAAHAQKLREDREREQVSFAPVVHEQPTDAQKAAAASAPSTAIPAPTPTEAAQSVPEPATAATVGAPPAKATQIAPPAAAAFTAESPERSGKHSSIQVTMLIVGVSLLSVAAIFFLVYAFITFGIIWQSVIIAAITVATIAAASLLRRRRLPATAEAIAVFGVVLVYLDAFAVRANNLFDLATSDGYVFWGTTLLVTSVAFMFWSRVSSLRAPSIVGFSSFAPAVGVLVAGLTRDGEFGTQPFLAFAAVAAAGLIHRWALPRAAAAPQSGSSRNVERIISLSTTTLALISGFFIAFVIAPSSDWSGTIAVIVLVVITAAHLWAIAPPTMQPTRAFAHIFSAMAAVFAASAFGFAAFRIDSDAFFVVVPAIAAAVVTLTFEAYALRGAPEWRKFSALGAWSAAGIFALTLIKPLWIAATWTAWLPSIGVTRGWDFVPTDVPTLPLELPGWSVLSLAIIGVITAAFWTFTKVIGRRGPILAWFGAAVLVAATPLLGTLWLIVAAWLAIAVAAIALLSIQRTRKAIPHPYHPALVTTAIVSGLFAYLISWASVSTWWSASLVAVALLVASRRIVAKNEVKATLFGLATVLVLIGSYAAALHIDYVSNALDLIGRGNIDGLRFSSIVATVLFALFAVPLGRMVTSTDRRVMFWLAGGTAGLLLSAASGNIDRVDSTGRMSLLLPEYATSLIAQLLFLAAIVAWIAFPTVRALPPERVAASVVAAPAAYVAIVAVTKVTTLPEFVLTVAPIAAALLVAAVALTAATVRPTSVPRWALDIGVVLVALPSVAFAVITGGRFAWFVLILAAVTALFLATSRDGLVASKSSRKHLGWVAIALATAGLWWQLGSSRVEALEPYVLPLAGALLATALLIAWAEFRAARRSPDDPAAQHTLSRSAAPLVALGGLLVAILPLGVNAITGSLTKAIVVASVSAALLLMGSLVIAKSKTDEPRVAGIRWQPWLDTAALAGALGVIVTAIGRAIRTSPFEWSGDVWLGAALVVLLAAGIGQARRSRATMGRLRAASSQALTIIPMTAVLAVEVFALNTPQLGTYRALGLIVLFATVTVLCFTVNRAPFGRVVGGVSTAFWAIATIATLVTFRGDLLLWLTPIASALLVAAIALATTLIRPGPVPRLTRDSGVIIVGALSVLISISVNAPHTWLLLLIAAVAVLLLAIDRDGLFSSTSRRRHLGWVSLALATGGLWWRLWNNDVTDLVPYVVPLAGGLFLIALLLEYAKSKASDAPSPQHSRAAPVIALGGLIVGILPLAVNASSGVELRAIIIGAVSAALLLAGSFVVGSRAAQRWWDSAALAGGIGVLVLMVGRAIHLPVSDVTRDAWIVGGFILLIATAFGQAIPRDSETARIRSTASQTFGLIAMFAVLVTEVPAFVETPSGQYRVLGLVALFAVVHVFASILQRAPLSLRFGWIAIALAGIAGFLGITMGAVDTPEFVTVPIALALLTTGAMHLHTVATSGSWPWLAPGLVVLLLPTLIENFREQELWRIVGLGVVGIAVIIVGLLRKLQAPFVIGVVVVLIHGISTFLPQLRAAYEFVPWWLWLGIGGAVLIAVAVRFEQRRRDMKAVVMKFSELR